MAVGQIGLGLFNGPSAVDSYYNARNSALDYKAKNEALDRNKVVQGREDTAYNQQQNSQAIDQLGAGLDQVKDGDAQGFESAKAFAVQNKLIDANTASQYTVNDLPRIRALSQQARGLAKEHAAASQQSFTNDLATKKFGLDQSQLAEQARHNRAAEAAAAATSRSGPKITNADKTELFKGTEAINGGQGALSMLNRAKELNKQSLQGYGSQTAASIGGLLFDDKQSNNTTEYQNLIEAQTLPQLKAVFGGMPTEGERAILLQVQGSLNFPRKVRENILDRAMQLVQRRIELNKSMNEGIRSGDFYQPGYEAPSGEISFGQQGGAPAAPAAAPGARKAAAPPPPPGPGYKVYQ